MAEITFKGFVQKHEGNRPWEVAESHSKKVDDKWVEQSRTYHKVWLPDEIGSLNEGDLVEVTGRQITPPKKGDFKPTPVVHASTVVVIKAGRSGNAPVQSAAEQPDTWNTATIPDETPF